MNAAAKVNKYWAVGKVTVQNHFAYLKDFLMRSIFLILILFIFMQLWQATFHGEGKSQIAGYTLEQILWYLIFTEAITLSTPSLTLRIEEEVKNGDIGYKLVRPVSYIGYHYFTFLGEVSVRIAVNLIIGSLLGIAMFGAPYWGWGWVGFLAAAAGGVTVNFLLLMLLSLTAFWVEETRGLEFVYNKILFTIGGMLMPLEIFPEPLQRISAWLPFQAVLYFPAKTAVDFDLERLLQMLCIQAGWIILLGAAVAALYRKGVRKLNVNGG